MIRLFAKLHPDIQRRLVATYARVPIDQIEQAYTTRPDLRRGLEDSFGMLQACAQADIEAVEALLDLGMDIDTNPDPLSSRRTVSPLIWAIYSVENADPDRGLALVDLLLARGANPNFISGHAPMSGNTSPMHSACCLPQVLKRLMGKGGDAQLKNQAGWSIADEWLWHAHSIDKKKRAAAFEALWLLQDNGLDLNQPLNNGSAFLVQCWASGGLRPHIPELISKGLDPYRRGAGKASLGNSLVEHLGKKTRNGKGGPLAQQIMAELAAQALDAASCPALGATSKPRL